MLITPLTMVLNTSLIPKSKKKVMNIVWCEPSRTSLETYKQHVYENLMNTSRNPTIINGDLIQKSEISYCNKELNTLVIEKLRTKGIIME